VPTVPNDRYPKLRPPELTPTDEICRCLDAPIKLMCAFGYNPLHCLNCNLEVAPETLALTESLVEALAGWRDVYDALGYLWLDSGPYEQWAQAQLADIGSAVNLQGRSVRQLVDGTRRCYYWLFQDESDPDHRSIVDCPVCGEALNPYAHGNVPQLICDEDSVVAYG